MFYILHKRKLIPIDPDRVYAFCPRCGVLHAVDLQAEIREMNFKKPETVKKVMPAGWIGAKGGLRIKTISFARQLAEL